MKIKDLVVGQKASLDLALGECSIRKTKGNPPRDFLSATLTDGTDTLDGKIWNYDARKGVPEQGKVYTVSGQIGEYQGKKQITLDRMDLSEDQSMERFEPMYVEHPEAFYDMSMNMIDAMLPGPLKTITQNVYTLYKTELLSASSAKGVHHVGHGGNIVHMWEVASLGCSITNAFTNYGDPVNRDLVVAGALLHDLGKCWTYCVDGAVIAYTRVGQELDHIVLGVMKLNEAILKCCPDLYNSKEAAALRHIISSHHGELEYGSPTTPLYAEAYIVSYADKISADMAVLRDANKKAIDEKKPKTDKIYTLHNREHILQTDVL